QQRELRLVAVNLHAGAYLHKVVAVNILGGGLELVPHSRFHRAAAVAQFHPQVRLAGRGVAHLFLMYQEKPRDRLVRRQIAYHGAFCHFDPLDLPNSRYFLWCFFSFVVSGVVLTSSISELPPPAISWYPGLITT